LILGVKGEKIRYRANELEDCREERTTSQNAVSHKTPVSSQQSNPVACSWCEFSKSADEGCLAEETPCHTSGQDMLMSSSYGVRF
jgi:hypothetical protein